MRQIQQNSIIFNLLFVELLIYILELKCTVYFFRYKFKNSKYMTENEHIATQYLALKGRVEDRIKYLQTQCYDSNNTRISDPSQKPQSQIPHCQSFHTSQHHHHPNMHQHHCCCSHSYCHDSTPSIYSQCSADRKSSLYDNVAINQVLAQNLRAQKEMNSNLRLLSDKISDISVKRSDTSNFIEQPNSSQTRRPTYFPQERVQSTTPVYERSKSEMGSRNKYGMKFRKSEIKDLIKKNKSPNKAKSRNFDYYTENKKKRNEKCPIHDHRDIEELYETRLKNKQVYKDSIHRNRKHERTHLVSAYKQQQKSRKQLLAKMSKNTVAHNKVK